EQHQFQRIIYIQRIGACSNSFSFSDEVVRPSKSNVVIVRPLQKAASFSPAAFSRLASGRSKACLKISTTLVIMCEALEDMVGTLQIGETSIVYLKMASEN